MKAFAIRLYFLLSVLFLSLISCSGQKPNVLTPSEYHAAINNNKDIQLIDVRTPEEFSEGHIEHAININYLGDNFSEEINKLDKNKPVYVYCRSGNRSGKSLVQFEKIGFKFIYDLDGGILNWVARGFNVVID